MLKKTLCSLLIGSSVLLGSGCATPKQTSFTTYKEVLKGRKTIKERPDAIILVSKPEEWWEHLRTPLEWMYEWAVAAALKERGVQNYVITFSAKERDLYRALNDPHIQTIVVAGHGQWGWWCASDDTIYESRIEQYILRNKIQKKQGLFIRHTCGQDRYNNNGKEKTAFGTSLMDEHSKTRGYDFIAGPIDYIFNPIPDYKPPKTPVQFSAKNASIKFGN